MKVTNYSKRKDMHINQSQAVKGFIKRPNFTLIDERSGEYIEHNSKRNINKKTKKDVQGFQKPIKRVCEWECVHPNMFLFCFRSKM